MAILLLCIALSADTFAAGMTYGSTRVKVPFFSMCILSLLSGFVFSLSLSAGREISTWIPEHIMTLVSFIILFLLAVYKLYDTYAGYFHPSIDLTKFLSGRVNRKEPSILSPMEASLLAVALSIDSITAGLGNGTLSLYFLPVFLLSSLIHFLAFLLGLKAGKKLLCRSRHSLFLSFLPAILFFLLAFSRLF